MDLGANFIGSMFLYLITTVGIILAAYYTTVWIGKKTSSLAKGRRISMLERTQLPGGIVISVVKIGQHVYVMATNGKNLEQLDRMSYEEWKKSTSRWDLEQEKNQGYSNRSGPYAIVDSLRSCWIGRKENEHKRDKD